MQRSIPIGLVLLATSCDRSPARSSKAPGTSAPPATPVATPAPQPAWTGADFTVTRDLAKLLTSPFARDQERSEREIREHGPALRDHLLRTMAEGGLGERAYAARLLAILVSPWVRGTDMGLFHPIALYKPRRPVERPVDHPWAPAVRKGACDELQRLFEHRVYDGPEALSSEYLEALQCTVLLLLEVADHASVKDLATLMSREKNRAIALTLMQAIETYLGVPATYDEIGQFCGFGEPQYITEERMRKNQARFEAARQSLLSQVEERTRMGEEAWRARRVATWIPDLGSKGLSWQVHSRRHWLDPLIRLGSAAVPLLAARLREGREDERFCRLVCATITGEIDPDFVRGLLAGSVEDQRWACDFISSASSTAWFKELRALALSANEEPRASAAVCLAICHPLEAVPILKQAAVLDEALEYNPGLCRDLELAVTKAQARWAAP